MKKAELITLLLGYKNLGDLDEESLEAMTVPNLNLLKEELDKELAEEAGETPESKKETPAEKPKEETPKAEFTPMCGLEFDPAAKSSCNVQCKYEFPDNFKECQENFKVEPEKKPAAKRGPSQGMNQWYHRPGSQGGNLDNFFTEGKAGTVAEIAAFAGCKDSRVMIHIKHLIADFDVEILKGTRKNKETKKAETIFFWTKKDKRRKGVKISGKTGFPKGFPSGHPCA